MEEKGPDPSYESRVLHRGPYLVEMAFDASQVESIPDENSASIRFKGGKRVSFDRTTFSAVDENTGKDDTFYIVGKLLDTDRSVKDKAEGITYRVIDSTPQSILSKVNNGTHSYIAKMFGYKPEDLATSLEKVLMFDHYGKKSFVDHVRNSEKTENSYRQLGQAILIRLGYYDHIQQSMDKMPKNNESGSLKALKRIADISQQDNEIKGQLVNRFGFTEDQADNIVSDFSQAREYMTQLDFRKRFGPSVDTKPEMMALALMYSKNGELAELNNHDFDVVQRTLQDHGMNLSDKTRFDQLKEFVRQVDAHLDHENLAGESYKRINAIRERCKDNPDMTLEEIAREYKGDIRLFLEHMNPVENYFLVTSDNVDRQRLKQALEKLARGDYEMPTSEMLAEINNEIGGGVLCITRVGSVENRDILKKFIEYQHNDGQLDAHEKEILSRLSTQYFDMNIAKLRKMKIEALVTDPRRAQYHELFSKIAVKVAEDGTYDPREQFEVDLALKALVKMKIYTPLMARYEHTKLEASCKIIDEDKEKTQAERFLDTWGEIFLYGFRHNGGEQRSRDLAAENLLHYLDVMFIFNTYDNLLMSIMAEQTQKIETELENGAPSSLSKIITAYRIKHGLKMPEGLSKEERYLADLEKRRAEYGEFSLLYEKADEFRLIEEGRDKGGLPTIDSIVKILIAKESLDYYSPEIFQKRINQVVRSGLMSQREDADMEWKKALICLAETMKECTTPEYKDSFSRERYYGFSVERNTYYGLSYDEAKAVTEIEVTAKDGSRVKKKKVQFRMPEFAAHVMDMARSRMADFDIEQYPEYKALLDESLETTKELRIKEAEEARIKAEQDIIRAKEAAERKAAGLPEPEEFF